MTSQNLKARNEVIDRGAVTRSQKGNKANVERKVGDCWQWQATGPCSEGDSCSFNHGVPASGKRSEPHRQKERSSSPTPNSKATKDGKGKSSDEKDGKSFDNRNKIACHWRNCTNPSCGYRHPPECQNYISQIGCRYGKNCYFRHVELAEKPNKKSKKRGANGSVAVLKELTWMNCVSRDPHPKKSIPWKEGQLGSSHKVQFSRSTWHHIKIREREGSSLGIIQKCEPHERSPCAPKFAERSQQYTLQQERCPRRDARKLAKIFLKLKNLDKATFYSPNEDWENKKNSGAGTHFTIGRGERIRGWFRKFNALAEQEEFELRWNGHSKKGPDTPEWSRRPMGKCKLSNRHKCMFTILVYSWQCNSSMTRLLFYRSAKITDIPMRGSTAKSHGIDNHVPLVVPGLSANSGSSTSSTSPFRDQSTTDLSEEQTWSHSYGKRERTIHKNTKTKEKYGTHEQSGWSLARSSWVVGAVHR